MHTHIDIRDVSSPSDIETVRVLLREYAAHLNSASGEEHICLNAYEEEVAGLPGVYAPPQGALLIAFVNDEPAGCVAMKPLVGEQVGARVQENAAEMKRLWVRPQYHGLGLGTRFTESVIARATAQGYAALYLDTLPSAMQAANHIYRKLGFVPVERYRERLTFSADAPVEVAFFRLDLTRKAPASASEERDRQGHSKKPAATSESQLGEAKAAWPSE